MKYLRKQRVMILKNDEILKPSIQKITGKAEFHYEADEMPYLFEDNLFRYYKLDENVLYVYHEPFSNKGNVAFKIIDGRLKVINWNKAMEEAEKMNGGVR